MWLIDWLIDWFTDWSEIGLLSSPRYSFLSLSSCLHTFILLSLLNIPSSFLSCGPFYFLFSSLFSVLSSILPPVPLYSLLFFSLPLRSVVLSFYFCNPVFLISCPFCSVIFSRVSSILFCFLLSSRLWALCCWFYFTLSSVLCSLLFFTLLYRLWAFPLCTFPHFRDLSAHLLIIIFINCSWVGTRWQWSFYIVW